jgi:hypothetical protein
MYTLYYLLFNTVYIKKSNMFRTMSQFILRDSIIYYTSYLCMVATH